MSELDSDDTLGLPSDDDEDDAEVEQAYAARIVAERLKALNERKKEKQSNKRKAQEELSEEDESGEEIVEGSDEDDDDDDDDDDADDDLDIEDIIKQLPGKEFKEVPKTAKEIKKDQIATTKKRAHADETPEERDERTLFIGNVPVACSTSKVSTNSSEKPSMTDVPPCVAVPEESLDPPCAIVACSYRGSTERLPSTQVRCHTLPLTCLCLHRLWQESRRGRLRDGGETRGRWTRAQTCSRMARK